MRLSERLRAQYPEDMTIILQHQFWDLTVTDAGFEVGMSFGGIPEKLYIPFAAVTGFFDPSVQFGLQFEEVSDDQAAAGKPAKETVKDNAAKTAAGKLTAVKDEPAAPKLTVPSLPAATAATAATASEPDEPGPDKPSGGGEVVRLDRFRKK